MDSAVIPPRRPLIVIPGRFSASASALRYGALVTAGALAEAVYAAGGEPLTVWPAADGSDVACRIRFADGVLLPGGGDLAPGAYGERVASADVYGVDIVQDKMDLAIARWAFAADVPLLAICRGVQVLNVALGGTLDQHMSTPHRDLVHPLTLASSSDLAGLLGRTEILISCYHHQRIARLAADLRVVARASDGTIEAVEAAERRAFCGAVQWHPEDTAATDPANAALFAGLVEASSSGRARIRPERGL